MDVPAYSGLVGNVLVGTQLSVFQLFIVLSSDLNSWLFGVLSGWGVYQWSLYSRGEKSCVDFVFRQPYAEIVILIFWVENAKLHH